MSISIELTKNSKPHIIHNYYKYRKSYTLKSGETIWRCLGRSCGATLKTDVNRESIVSSNEKHSGPHPSTMRSLMSSHMSSSPTPSTSPVPAASPAPAATSAPDASSAPAAPSTPAASSTPPSSSTPLASSAGHVGSHAPVALRGLEDENMILRLQIADLQRKYQDVLDHSVESDTRLLQFTNQIFVADTSRIEPSSCVSKIDRAVQCEQVPNACQDPWCVETHSLVSRLRNTIHVLEADNLCLRAEADRCECHRGKITETWTVVPMKNVPIETQNKFTPLATLPEFDETASPKTRNGGEKGKKKKKRNPQEQPTTSLPFQTVIIEGDSHARHLAGLVQQRVKLPTRVSGICKPSAGLLDATSGAPPPPGSCCVILAGSNDIVTGESQSIYRHLEQRIIARLASSRVIVATIPQRHDLPVDHIVNQTTTTVNHYIEELCARCEGFQLLNINSIERRWFTRHGLHLRLSGKRILAGRLVRSLVEVGRLPFSKSPPSPIKYNPDSTSPNKLQSLPISTPFQSNSSLSPIQVPSLDTPCTDNTPNHPIVRPGNFDTYADAVAGTFTERENENGRFPNQKNSIFDSSLKKG
ncbi:hypothetical protein J6590_069444 [Homalodisca vitripennis]|nr:hypothetical protein J6590_069444 [Homalodisca vitripennis]